VADDQSRGAKFGFHGHLTSARVKDDAVAAFSILGDDAFEIANHRVNIAPLFVFIKLGYDADFNEAYLRDSLPFGTPAGR